MSRPISAIGHDPVSFPCASAAFHATSNCASLTVPFVRAVRFATTSALSLKKWTIVVVSFDQCRSQKVRSTSQSTDGPPLRRQARRAQTRIHGRRYFVFAAMYAATNFSSSSLIASLKLSRRTLDGNINSRLVFHVTALAVSPLSKRTRRFTSIEIEAA